MQSCLRWLIFACAALTMLPVADAQATSSRTLVVGVNDWYSAAAWNNGVPSAAADVAHLQFPGPGTSQLQLGAAVTLEQLIVGGVGTVTLQGAGPLQFANDGAGDLLFQLAPTSGVLQATLTVPVALVGTPLFLDVPVSASLDLNGSVNASNGNLVKQGAGQLRLGAANTLAGSQIIVQQGTVVAGHASALGDAISGTVVHSGARLALRHATAEPVSLTDGELQVVNLDYSGPLTISGGAVVARPQNQVSIINGMPFETTLGSTNVNGVISGGGNLTIQNQSRDALFLRGNNTYTGHTYITSGAVNATTGTALGDATEGTTINGGRLQIQAPTSERFRVESGSLVFNAGDFVPTDSITIANGEVRFPTRNVVATPIVVEGLGAVIRGTGSYTGGSTGVGNLRVGNLGVDAPLNHHGNLILENARLNVANNHTGETIFASSADVNHVGAFGQSQIIRIQGGEARLIVLPTGTPQYALEGGSLTFPSLAQVASPITIGGGAGYATLLGNAVYQGPIHVLDSLGNRLAGGTFNGSISGPGALELGGSATAVNLNAANSFTGRALVRGGHVHVNHVKALDLNNTNLSSGTLHLNAPAQGQVIVSEETSDRGTIAFHVDQNLVEPWVLNAGTLIATSANPLGMRRLITLGGVEATRLQGNVRIDEELTNVFNVNIEASLYGAGDVRNIGNEMTLRGRLADFAGRVIAERGITVLHPLAANTLEDGEIHVHNDATLQFFGDQFTDDMAVDADIFLHNARGGSQLYAAALVHDTYVSELRLQGRLDVGDQGSKILGNFIVSGQITGSELYVSGGGTSIISPQDQLQKIRVANNSHLETYENGRLAGLTSIELENRARFRVTWTTGGTQDSIADNVPINSRGGSIGNNRLLSPQSPRMETFGQLTLQRGLTQLIADSSGT